MIQIEFTATRDSIFRYSRAFKCYFFRASRACTRINIKTRSVQCINFASTNEQVKKKRKREEATKKKKETQYAVGLICRSRYFHVSFSLSLCLSVFISLRCVYTHIQISACRLVRGENNKQKREVSQFPCQISGYIKYGLKHYIHIRIALNNSRLKIVFHSHICIEIPSISDPYIYPLSYKQNENKSPAMMSINPGCRKLRAQLKRPVVFVFRSEVYNEKKAREKNIHDKQALNGVKL